MNGFDDNDMELKKAISKSRLRMPNAAFEQQLIARMQQETQRKNSLKNIRYSILCFSLFAALCLAGNYLLPGYVATLSGVPGNALKLVFEACFVFCMLIAADSYIRFFKRNSLR
jgi:hypothetical protein